CCDDIWENICDVQGKDSSTFLTNANNLTNDSAIYESDDDCGESNENYLSSTISLPSVELSQLHDICNLFSPDKVRDATRRDLLARAVESENYIKKLLDLFHICEDLENIDSLHQLYEIIRSIFYLNKSTLFEILCNDEYIMDIVGCLEYEPQLTIKTKRNHREFLNKKATFKEVIPIGNQELLGKIHQTYRIQYIQDAILPTPSLFEENLLSTMNSFLFFNKVEIVTLLYEDPKFLSQLFATLKDDNLLDDKRKDLMLFLKEFCVFSQTLQQQNRDNFFQALATHGILNVIQVMLSLDDITTKQAALDVFISIVECNPSTVREYMLQETQSTQDDDELLLNLVISEMQSDPDPVQRLRKEERDLDVDEENWFNDDIDENKISSLNHGTLFNDGSDDDDSQPEIASAISTGEPSRTHHSLSDNDDDDDLSPSSHAHYNKPVISIHIGRSPMPSSSSTTDLPLDTSSPTSSQIVEASSPYAMSPALSSIADQYNDDDDDEEEEEDEDEEEEEEEEEPEDDEEENNSDSYSILKKRKLDNNDHERNKVFKPNSDQS
ncbi:unnamed protein product, partial [Rotaria sp. Silwood2]